MYAKHSADVFISFKVVLLCGLKNKNHYLKFVTRVELVLWKYSSITCVILLVISL